MLCLCNSTKQSREEIIARCVDVGLVVLERERHVLVGKEAYLCAILVGKAQFPLLHEFEHGTPCELVETALADETHLAHVLAEEEARCLPQARTKARAPTP